VSPPESGSDSVAKPLPARRLIDIGLSFTEQLTMHHTIEETYIFPHLAKKMPSFRPDAFAYTQHKAIHQGIDRLEAYLRALRRGERELRREEVKEIMDDFGGVLWQHLDEEVKELGAENMAKFWTPAEMQRIPF
jgi:hemerythrin-like domain-containing protein